MKFLSLLTLMIFIQSARAACLQEREMSDLKAINWLLIDIKNMEEAAASFEDQIVGNLPQEMDLVIHLEPNNPRINAEITRKDKSVLVSVWGGMLSHRFMDEDTFILLLCHEIGHLLGGPPLKSRNGWSSTEGQADYYSSGRCLQSFAWDEERFLRSALKLTQIYADVTGEASPKLDTCDSRQVERTNYGYPQVQCRLDTLVAGWRGTPRPRCWFYQ